jgi:hypothetical protein
MSTLRSSPAAASKVHLFQGILLMRFGGSARAFRKDVAGLPRTPSRSVETKHSLSLEGEETYLQLSSIIVLLRSFPEGIDDATTVKASKIEKTAFDLCAITTRTAAGFLPW